MPIAEGDPILPAGTMPWVEAIMGPLIGGAVVWIWNQRNVNRKNVIGEWQEYAAKLENRITDLETKDAEKTTELMATKIAEAKCQGQVTQLIGDVNLLNANLRRIQEKVGDTPPGVTLPCEVIADQKGIIRWASASVGPMFHWLPTELVGRNISTLLPRDMIPIHKRAFEMMLAEGRQPDPQKTILSYGQTKDGKRIPIMINLCGWEGLAGQHYINSEIRRRGDSDVFPMPSPDDVPTAKAKESETK